MKKVFKVIIALSMCFMIFALSSCFFAAVDDDNITLTEKKVDFVNLSTEYDVKNTTVDLYFYENGNVPLIDVTTYYNTLEGFYQNNTRKVSVNKLFNKLYIIDKDYSYRRVIFDWYYNTVTFKNTVSVYPQYKHGSIDFNAHYDIQVVKGISALNIEYYLKNYNIDILFYQNKVLMPIAFVNFINSEYYNVLYNGDKLYGFYYGNDINTVYQTSTMTGEVPEDIKEETKSELLFLLNEMYGLKKYSKVDNYKDAIGEKILTEFMGNANERDSAYMKIIHTLLNDPHSRMQKLSFYHNADYIIRGSDYLNDNDRYTKVGTVLSDLREKVKESEVYTNPVSENLTLVDEGKQGYIYYKGNTVFISFDDFLMGTTEQVYADSGYKADAYNVDTPALFYKALTETKNKHSEVSNVVIDVSRNGGGYIAACYKILSFISDNIHFGYSVGSDYTEVYKIKGDTNLDNQYSGSEAFTGFNYYVLESEGSFSAANSFACIAKYSSAIKTIGKRSGGGMCPVIPYALSDGTRFTLSGTNSIRGVQELEKEYAIYEVESGAPVDIPLEYADFYNFDKIVQIINQQ